MQVVTASGLVGELDARMVVTAGGQRTRQRVHHLIAGAPGQPAGERTLLTSTTPGYMRVTRVAPHTSMDVVKFHESTGPGPK